MKMLLVGGNFDIDGGRPSKIVETMSEHLDCNTINGGHVRQLDNINFKEWEALIWMPNISNQEEKILPTIKDPVAGNHKLLLISSKNSIDRDYTYSDFIGRMLQTKSNLGIYIEALQENSEYKLQFSVFDPLGNVYIQTSNIMYLCKILLIRIKDLNSFTRVGSKCIGEGEDFEIEEAFISEIHKASDQFSKFINAHNPYRLLGNASTRCASGFPAFRDKNRMFVTRRNVDKTNLSSKDFVEVKMGDNQIFYYGENKPSVDTAIQLKIFKYYKNINYIIHGHAYIKRNFCTTSMKIPCGAVEEFEEVKKIWENDKIDSMYINLNGHGCLIATDTIEKLRLVEFTSRPFPEERGRFIYEGE